MTKNTAVEEKIISLYKQRVSRSTIARSVGVSEWRVRCVTRDYITTTIVKGEVQQKNTGKLRVAKVKKAKTGLSKAAILNDIHIPYHCQKGLAVAMEYLKDYKPRTIILNGDIIDCYSVSSHRKDPIRLHTFQDEVNETKDFLATLRKQHPSAFIFFVKGNHEDRIERFILDKAPEITSLDCLSIDKLLELEKFKITFIDEKQHVVLGDLEVTHGRVVRKWSGQSAKAHHEKTGGSVLHGHVHRLGTFYHTNRWGTHVSAENGHLTRTDFDYVDHPDWQQGFTTVEYYEDGRFSLRQHPIMAGCLIVDGTTYTAE
ncbi:MAG: metallophosphoesterase [Candidatus Thorarchaeota archaeon]|jgi:predicted MPP superfamily phosphohydrolase